MRGSQWRGMTVVVAALGSLMCGGCPPIVINVTPPPEAVLEGVWQLTTDESTDVNQTFLTFDATGDLIRVVYQIGDDTTVTDNSPRGTVDVNGKAVTIDSTFAGSGQIIRGTLNEDNTVITGNQGTEVRIGDTLISVDNGTVTLTKQ